MNRIDEINALTVEDTLHFLLSRILDLSNFSETLFMLDQDESLSFYNRIIMHEDLVKPEESRLNGELAEYKTELIAAENARLAEVARVEGLTNRFNAISNIRGVLNHADLMINNPAQELKRIIEENDETQLALFESKSAEFEAKMASSAAKSVRVKKGENVRRISHEIMDLVAGYNVERSLTVAQVDSIESTFADIIAALTMNRIDKAKPLIEGITPDGTLVTQEMKDAILSIYTENGL